MNSREESYVRYCVSINLMRNLPPMTESRNLVARGIPPSRRKELDALIENKTRIEQERVEQEEKKFLRRWYNAQKDLINNHRPLF